MLLVEQGALAPGLPDDLLATAPIDAERAQAFAAVPAGASVVARFIDGAPAAIARRVGAGQVLAFASDPMVPSVLDGLRTSPVWWAPSTAGPAGRSTIRRGATGSRATRSPRLGEDAVTPEGARAGLP